MYKNKQTDTPQTNNKKPKEEPLKIENLPQLVEATYLDSVS